MDIPSQIIAAIKNAPGYTYTEPIHTIIFENLCEMMPDTSRHLIVAAIADMDGVDFIDPLIGTIEIPSTYFK